MFLSFMPGTKPNLATNWYMKTLHPNSGQRIEANMRRRFGLDTFGSKQGQAVGEELYENAMESAWLAR